MKPLPILTFIVHFAADHLTPADVAADAEALFVRVDHLFVAVDIDADLKGEGLVWSVALAVAVPVMLVVVVALEGLCLGLGPGLFLRLLMLTAAPPSAEDWVMGPGASRLGRREAAVWGVVVWWWWGLEIGSGGAGVDLWTGVDVRRDERVGRVVAREPGSREWRVEWWDCGRESTGGVGSSLGARDVRRVELARRGGERGVERDDIVEDAAGRLICRGTFVISVCPFGSGEGLGPTFCLFLDVVAVSAEGVDSAFDSSSFLLPLVFFPIDLVPLAVGEVAELLKFAKALPSGLNRFLKADPISPSLLAAASASAAARAACSRARVSRFNFLASFSFIPRLRTAATSTVGVSPLCTNSPFSRDLSRLSASANSTPFASASALTLK